MLTYQLKYPPLNKNLGCNYKLTIIDSIDKYLYVLLNLLKPRQIKTILLNTFFFFIITIFSISMK